MNKVLCSKCNNECMGNDKFCSNCGEKLTTHSKIKEETPNVEVSEQKEEIQKTQLNNNSNIDEMSDIYNWYGGLITAGIAIAFIVRAPLCSVIFFAIATILIPPLKTKLENTLKIKISGSAKTVFIAAGILFSLIFWVVQDNENNYKTNLQLAEKYFKNKNYAEAIKYYNTAKEYKPSSAEVKSGLAEASKFNKLQMQIELKSHITKGNKYYSQKNWGNAIDEFNKSISIDKTVKKILSAKLKKSQQEVTKQQKIKELALAKKQKAEERAKEIKQMKYFEGTGVQIAVPRVKITNSTEDHSSIGKSRFVWVDIAAYNNTGGTAAVNPNDFTLSDSDGYTVSHDTDTYSLSNYFDAVNLPPNGQTDGWIIFYLPKDSRYTLHYNGFYGNVDKNIVAY